MGILDTLANTFGAGRNGAGSSSMPMPQGMENYSRMQGVRGTLDEIVKSYLNKTCSLDEINTLLYGSDRDPMALSSIVTVSYIKDLMEKFGLNIIKLRKNGYEIMVEACREK